MLASVLKRLADAGDASKSDLNPVQTYIGWKDGRAISWYRGQYAACGISIPTEEEIPECALNARQFKDLINGLFGDDANLKLATAKNTLNVSTGRRRASFRFEGEPDFTEYWRLLDDEATPTISVDREAFIREINLAADIVATTLSVPVLTGIRVSATKDRIGIQAANGTSMMLQSSLPANTGSVSASVVVPTVELKQALATMRGQTLRIAIKPGAIVLRGDDVFFSLPVMSGTWPALQSIISKLTYRDEIILPSQIIKDATTAVRVYGADADVRFFPDKSGVSIATIENESGQFVESVEGSVSTEYRFDVTDLITAAKASDGDVLMAIGSGMARITADRRTLYMQQRYSG